MQLIDIIQIILVGLIAGSSIIFAFSYVLYRTKSSNTKPKQNLSNVNYPTLLQSDVIKSLDDGKLIQRDSNSIKKEDLNDVVSSRKIRKKFEVFSPSPIDSENSTSSK